jgi:hypothetical protein
MQTPQTLKTSNTALTPSSARDWGFLLACALCSLPALVPTFPAMVDLPQHAAQIEAIKGVITGDWQYAPLFQITYLTPYWIGYIFALLLSPIVGSVWAVKLVAAFALACLPWCAWQFLRLYHPPVQLRWLLLPIPFGFAYEWGFLNFLISISVGFITLRVILAEGSQKAALWKGVLWVHLLFLAHILTAAMFCSIAAFLMMTPWRGFAAWLKRMTPQLSVLPVLLAYVLLTLMGANNAADPIAWHLGWHRLPELVQGFISGPTPALGFALTGVALAAPWLLGAKWQRSLAYFLPFALYLAWMLFIPHYVLGNFFNYQRFGFIGYPLYLLCFNYSASAGQHRHSRLVSAGLLTVSLAMLAFQVNRVLTFDREYADYEHTIAEAEPGKRMLIFAVDRYSAISQAPLYLHFPSWYQAQTKGLVDYSFASMFVVIEYKDKARHPIRSGFEWYPLNFDWQRNQGDLFDYFIFRSLKNPVQWMQAKSGCRAQLVSHHGAWWLFARTVQPDPACEPASVAGTAADSPPVKPQQ